MAKSLRDTLKNIERKVQCLECNDSGGDGLEDVMAGTNITIDKTNPKKPIISATGEISSDLTLEQARQNGNVLEGDTEIKDSVGRFISNSENATFSITPSIENNGEVSLDFRHNNDNYRNIILMSNVYLNLQYVTNDSDGINSTVLTLNKDGIIAEISNLNSKGIIGDREYNKQGDRKAFAQLSDVYDKFNQSVSATQVGIVNNTPLQELGGVDKTINSVRVGRGAGTGTSNDSSVVLGENSLGVNTTGVNNTAISYGVLRVNTTGRSNIGVGTYSLYNNTTGQYNVAIGDSALWQNTTGVRNTAINSGALNANTTGQLNSAVGVNAGYSNVSGSYNTFLGNASAYNNGIGSHNIAIGYFSLNSAGGGGGAATPTYNQNRNIFIGCKLIAGASVNDTLAIDNKGDTNTNATDALIYGGFSVANRFVKINGTLSINSANLVNDDPTYTKAIVAKPDGTLGWQDKLENMVSSNYGTTTNILKSTQFFTTGNGTGSTTVLLNTAIPIGSLVFVSDLGNQAEMNNITIDVGIGNTILEGNGSMPMQTMIISSSGLSYTLRKMTANKWMVIGTNQ